MAPVPLCLEREDSLAQQLRLLSEAKSIAANELLQSEKRLAERKAQLRHETFRAVQASGLSEALKRWPEPRSETERPETPPRPETETADVAEQTWTSSVPLESSYVPPEETEELPAVSASIPTIPPVRLLKAPAEPEPEEVVAGPAPQVEEVRERSPAPQRPPLLKASSSPRNSRISPRRRGMISGSLLEEARRCSNALNKIASHVSSRNLRELRKMQQHPPQVLKIIEAVAVLLGDTDGTAVNVQEVLTDSLPQKLASFDPGSITASQRSKVKSLLKLPDVQPDAVASICHHCASLSQWCECVMAFLRADLVEEEARSAARRSARRSEKQDKKPPEPNTAEKTEPNSEPQLVTFPDLSQLSAAELKSVRELTVSRPDVGSVIFHGLTDCSDLQVERDIVLQKGFILVYPDPVKKPQPGCGLNKPATVTMYNCFPPGELLMEDPLVREDYKEKIRLMTEENRTCKFLDYDCQRGIWQFEVNRF